MPIITKAGLPVKGSPTQFTLDKSALAAVTSVAADAYYSQSTNWKEVQLNYKSSTGNQSEIVKFDATLASPTANFSVSLKARDVFQVHKIIIKDFDGGIFEVPRSALTTADFDVDMSGPAPVVNIDLTQGALPVGTNVATGATPVMSGASAKFTASAQINFPISYTYISGNQYKARLYVKDVSKQPGTFLTLTYNSLFRTSSSNPIFETQPFFYQAYNPERDLDLIKGSYVDFVFTAGAQFNDGWPVILSVSISPSGSNSFLEITKFEIFEV